MKYWRIVVVAFLILVPFTGLAAFGSYYLYETNYGFIAWWPMAACMAAGYLLGWYWQRQKKLLPQVDFAPPVHWTERDHKAKQLVEARAREAEKIPQDKLVDLNFYLDTAKSMALELAQFYHPGAKDPVGNLTVPEILAVVELASHDMAERVDKYLPGGHLLTVNHWLRAKQAADWAPAATNVYWIVAAFFNPVQTALRFAASQVGTGGTQQMFQQYLLLWFYTAFVERVGTYLIEVNSGRLRVGAERYRQLVKEHRLAEEARAEAGANGQTAAPDVDPAEQVDRVTVTLMGQVKVGKSSVVNAFLGEQRAKTDVLPATAESARYELTQPGIATKLELVDTVGYAHTGPKADQLKTTQQLAQRSDILLLVLHARNPGRQADLQMLQGLRKWFDERPELKRPPILAVVTHIDLLSPAMEWSPPYHWQKPTRTKEQQIQQALQAVQEQLGDYLTATVPVCAAGGKVYGIDEWVLPAVTELLSESHAVALLRCLKAEADTGKVRKVFAQTLELGKAAVKVVWKELQR
jgi:uncharacterized protein